jgi:predicted permease
LIARLAVLPRVRSVSLAGDAVFGNGGWNAAVYVRRHGGTEDTEQVPFNVVGPGFFETVGIHLLAGREFGEQDQFASPSVAIVNRTFARKFFEGKNPVGRRFGNSGYGSEEQIEIVGMIADAKYGDLREGATPMFYLPVYQWMGTPAYEVHVRVTDNLPATAAAVRREIESIDQNVFVFPAQTIPDVIQRLLQHDRMFAILAGLFGLLALLMTAIGIYGLVAYQATRRTREIGIRMALGAQHRDILWIVVRETIWLMAVGVGVGVPAAVAAGRLLQSNLFALRPSDPLTIVGSAATLVTVGAFAALLPAQRTSKVDPMVALRHE